MRIEQGLIAIPAGVDPIEFLKHDGKVPTTAPAPGQLTLPELRDRYLAARVGASEANTLATCRVHFGHLSSSIKDSHPISDLTAAKLQEHVNRRSGEGISPVTIKKEIATLRAAWNWASDMGWIAGTFPNKGLLYPKTDDKPPFRTRAEIARQIDRGGLSAEGQATLWECLFLTLPEIADLLATVKARPSHAWVYPAFCFVAHTGARRSEMLRARIDDVDFEGESILIREKKRTRGKRTTRRAPLSSFLAEILGRWIANHPGGNSLFCGEEGNRPLSEKDALRGFRRAVLGTEWEVMRGWHALRHSFITGCVTAGVDQRLIDDWVGHTTEEMRRRYRHLVPSAQREAIRAVFG